MSALHWIAPDAPPDAFPPVELALADPEGLLASGGDLSEARLIAAYRQGIFPWYETGQPVLWWSPDPRAFIPAGGFHVSKSLRRTLRQSRFSLAFDSDFLSVITACAAPRRGESLTWITPEMIAAYCALHAAGIAHSVEVLVDGELAGGIYGVSLGRMFCAESMFSRISDASKIALAALIWQLEDWGFPGVDCQVQSAHLDSLGCVMLPRKDFVVMNAAYQARPPPAKWAFEEGLIERHLGAKNPPNPR